MRWVRITLQSNLCSRHLSNRTIFPKIGLTAQFCFFAVCLTGRFENFGRFTVQYIAILEILFPKLSYQTDLTVEVFWSPIFKRELIKFFTLESFICLNKILASSGFYSLQTDWDVWFPYLCLSSAASLSAASNIWPIANRYCF